MSQAIAQMEKVTQTTAATAEESAAASEELNAQSESALSVVGDLQTLVDGQAHAASGEERPLTTPRMQSERDPWVMRRAA